MQAQYGPNPRKLRDIVSEMYTTYGWRQGIMRGYWVSTPRRCGALDSGAYHATSFSQITVVREIPAYGGELRLYREAKTH